MIYNFSITIPSISVSENVLIRDLKLTHGIIHKIEFIFPPGPSRLTGIAIYDAIHQIWPTNTDMYFFSDDETISFQEHYPLLVDPYTLQAHCINIDDTFQHTIGIRIGILPPEVIAPWLLNYDKRILNALGAG
jgi:hypothetical protein